MMFILRLPAIIILLALSAVSLLAGAGAAAAMLDMGADIQGLSGEIENIAATQPTWLDVGLLVGAGLLFLVAAIRLIRRTQAFWAWLIGFALFGARWALSQEDLMGTLSGLRLESLDPAALLGDLGAPEAQLAALALILIVGLILLLIDGADRAHWDRQEAA